MCSLDSREEDNTTSLHNSIYNNENTRNRAHYNRVNGMLMLELFSLLIIVTFMSAQESSVGRRVPSFIASRGKKHEADVEKEVALFDYESVDKVEDHADDIRYPMSKRAPLGFQGTRGKKISDFSYKRATGFAASRGKKYDDPLLHAKTDVDDYWLIRNELAKRKFYGMRGKKLPSYRPNAMSVMGVRGKKGPSSSTFFGTRGKKYDATLFVNRPTTAYTDGTDNTDFIENLATTMYLLSADKDYSKHHSDTVDSDLDEISSDVESQSQDQQLPSNDETSAR